MTLDPKTVAVLDAIIAEKTAAEAKAFRWQRGMLDEPIRILKELRTHAARVLDDNPPPPTVRITAELRGPTDARGIGVVVGDRLVFLPAHLTTMRSAETDAAGRVMAALEIPEWLAKNKELL